MNDIVKLVALPGYSPDFNPDEAVWDWIHEDVTANTCFVKTANVPKKVDDFFAALAERTEEVKLHCRRNLQVLADDLVAKARR
jgi:transposase